MERVECSADRRSLPRRSFWLCFRDAQRTALPLPTSTSASVSLSVVVLSYSGRANPYLRYGIIYLFSEALEVVYQDGFDFSTKQCSLIMLAIGVGVVFTFLPRIYDVRVAVKRRAENKPLEPEDKLFGFLLAAPVLAAGLWWFAWTVPPLVNVSPWASVVSLVFLGYSVVEFGTYKCVCSLFFFVIEQHWR